MKTDLLATIIKVGAVLTAAPRWVGALLAAEGFALPAAWVIWWVPVSAILSACMAIVEGLAFAYVFESWRNQQDRDSDRLLWFALLSAVIFVVVLAPYIAAQVAHITLAEVLTGWVLYAWSVAVGASTISIVASVGYAQKKRATKPAPKNETTAQPVAQLEETTTKQKVLMLREMNPNMKQDEIAQEIGISRQMVGRYLKTHSNGRNHAENQ